MKVMALGADDPAPDENTVISSEPVSILFVLRYVYILTSYFHAGLWIRIHFISTQPGQRRAPYLGGGLPDKVPVEKVFGRAGFPYIFVTLPHTPIWQRQ